MSKTQKTHDKYLKDFSTANRSEVSHKSEGQKAYIESIRQNDVTFCLGPAGSGKTNLAVGLACEFLQKKRVDRIIITRPTIEAGNSLGFLPGNEEDKIYPYLIPIIEEMYQYIGKEWAIKLKEAEAIIYLPLQLMRGRNFNKDFMILDEAQNATYEQVSMFIKRLGFNSRCIINGDPHQSDLPLKSRGGAVKAMDRLSDVKGVGCCYLQAGDIVRNPILNKIIPRLDAED